MDQEAKAAAVAAKTSAPSLLLIAGLVALGQFASLVFSPAIPSAAAALGTSSALVLLTASAYMGATALMLLVAGPLSDVLGRRPLILGGLGLFVVGSIAAIVASDISTLFIGRIIQAFGSAAVLVAARAATRDIYTGPALQKAMTTITLAFALSPALAPLLGGLAAQYGGFRATFALALAFGLLLSTLALVQFRETATKRDAQSEPIRAAFASVIGDPKFVQMALIGGLSNAGIEVVPGFRTGS